MLLPRGSQPLYNILPRNERRLQAKYDEDESTLSEESSIEEMIKCRFQRLDMNRQKRKSVLMRPIDLNVESVDKADTLRRLGIFNTQYLFLQVASTDTFSNPFTDQTCQKYHLL